MPKLPSGRYIAIDASPFDDLIERARTERNAALLLCIGHPRHILPLLHVVEVEERPDIPEAELARVSAPWGEVRCMTCETGYTASDLLGGRSGWPECDARALERFLDSRRLKHWMRDRYKQLTALRGLLGELVRLEVELGENIRRAFFAVNRRKP
ncbi:MAG: hypothetical protein JHC52_11200 [Chthoniobacterales bacterium]|nr:hypothetical protein [Chthoniobacterales bacterium]